MRNWKAKATNGFTLIEVMIAVLVLSIALGASISVLGQYADVQGRLERRYLGHLVAWNELMRSFTASEVDLKSRELWLVANRDVEMAGGQWRVDVESERLGETGMWLYEVEVYTSESVPVKVGSLKAYLKR